MKGFDRAARPGQCCTMDAADETLADLLCHVASEQNISAFRMLYDLTRPRLTIIARFGIQYGIQPDDILQIAYVRIWQRVGTYDRALGSAMGWVLRICRNVALDEIRKERALRRREADVISEGRETPQFGVESYLESLPSPHAAILRSVYVEGLTQLEVAERLGVPLGTVKSRVRRALIAIRETLADESAGQGDVP